MRAGQSARAADAQVSEKLYDPQAYATPRMARDAVNLLAHLGIGSADVMGYSMGARIGAFLVLAHRDRVRSLVASYRKQATA